MMTIISHNAYTRAGRVQFFSQTWKVGFRINLELLAMPYDNGHVGGASFASPSYAESFIEQPLDFQYETMSGRPQSPEKATRNTKNYTDFR